jgi:3-oxoacyl-[acyl-carrier-protein] synthase II
MEIYIQAASAMPANTIIGRGAPGGNRRVVTEPDYTGLIDPKSIRRMSRIIRMGVGAAIVCLREPGISKPHAIVTATAYGCLADTEVFLSRMIAQQEEMLPPTAFIQSTHNTVGGQIALLLQCHGYNNTFVHRGHSFESALLDAVLLLEEDEGEVSNVLVGAVDETTDISHAILSRFGLYRRAVAGEGAAFFLLTSRPPAGIGAGAEAGVAVRLERLETFYRPQNVGEIEDRVQTFLRSQSIGAADIDLVIMGNNSDASRDTSGDAVYQQLSSSVFKGRATANYKNDCGEYPTSVSYALWLAVQQLRAGNATRILIYNHYMGMYHSLILVSR